jgi:hypothetical protein
MVLKQKRDIVRVLEYNFRDVVQRRERWEYAQELVHAVAQQSSEHVGYEHDKAGVIHLACPYPALVDDHVDHDAWAQCFQTVKAIDAVLSPRRSNWTAQYTRYYQALAYLDEVGELLDHELTESEVETALKRRYKAHVKSAPRATKQAILAHLGGTVPLAAHAEVSALATHFTNTHQHIRKMLEELRSEGVVYCFEGVSPSQWYALDAQVIAHLEAQLKENYYHDLRTLVPVMKKLIDRK